MGILALGLGLGGVAVFAAALHLVFNALTKGALFLCAGNIHRAFASKHLDQVQGAGRLLPWSGGIFLAGFLAITGSPPFAPFISEFTLLTGAFNAGHWAVAAAFLALLMLVFLGMGEAVLGALLGTPPAESRRSGERDSLLSVLPPLALMALVLMLGFWIPAPLRRLATDTAGLLGTKP
jgi:hydrogenase-4 component F